MSEVQLHKGNCLEIMKDIPDKSVDMILCDLPYGTTACKWDIVIPFEPLWEQYKRVCKDNAAIVLFGSQPFTSLLVNSNLPMFKYEWIYKKIAGSNFATAHRMPIKEHENICVFYSKQPTYNPQMQERSENGKKRLDNPYHTNSTTSMEFMGNSLKRNNADQEYNRELRLPGSVQKFNNRAKGDRGLHPTQKPVALLEYLIKTYTNEGDTVLDNCMGSGSTGVACKNTNRNFIGIELNDEYFEIAEKRINDSKKHPLHNGNAIDGQLTFFTENN